MTITPMTIYWMTKLDGIISLAFMFMIFNGLAFGISCIIYTVEKEHAKFIKNALITSFSAFIFSLMTCVFIPSTEEMAAIIVLPKLASAQNITDVNAEIVDLAKNWIKDLASKHQSHDKTKDLNEKELLKTKTLPD